LTAHNFVGSIITSRGRRWWRWWQNHWRRIHWSHT